MARARAAPVTAALVALALAACTRATLKPSYEEAAVALPRPERILVYDFAFHADQVTENQGIVHRALGALSTSSKEERGEAIGREVARRLSDDIVRGIRDLGLPAERADTGVAAPSGALAVTGWFLDVDEGNRLRRAVIGFGAGQSKLDTSVQLRTMNRRLLEFDTHADSGQLPGAAATMGVGAAAQGAVTAGMGAASAGVSGGKEYRSTLEALAGMSARQTVAYLSEYFAKQGWISADDVRRLHRPGASP